MTYNLQDLKEVLNVFYNSPRSVYIAVIDEEGKSVLIRYSANFIDGAKRLTEDLRNNTAHPYLTGKAIKLEILEAHTEVLDRAQKQNRLAYWLDFYKNLGYNVLNNQQPVKYDIIIQPVLPEGRKTRAEAHVFVRAVNGRKELIGRFPTLDKANKWIDYTYGSKRIVERIIKHTSVR